MDGNNGPTFLVSLLSGAIAGTTVDVALFPLDTIKTRLQAPGGFWRAGGFNGIYKGLSAAAVGSAPGAALFFSSYEMGKKQFSQSTSLPNPAVHMLSASIAEVVACLVRVPTEVVKQRMQTGGKGVIRSIIQNEGFGGFFAGFGVTVMREIPFSLIQFPIYEYLKVKVSDIADRPAAPHESALCGSFSGAIAGALTTPLDVLKTRLMLGADAEGIKYRGAVDAVQRIYQEGLASPRGPVRTFFSGVEPRVMWISIGGFFFFGAYEQAKSLLMDSGL